MRKILFSLSLLILLTGCKAAPQTQPTSSVVSQITVDGAYEGARIQGHYVGSAEIRNILLHIRALRPRHSAIAEGEGETVSVVLTYRDGRQKQYLLKAATYWQEDGQGWKTVETQAAEKLCVLLLQLQGDFAPQEKE